MALKLHPECKARLERDLAEALPHVRVNNRKFLDRSSTYALFLPNTTLPDHGPLAKRLESYVGEWPFYDFLYGSLSKELYEEGDYDASLPDASITDLDQYSDPNEAARRLVAAFDSLPWEYVFSFRMPQFLSLIFENGDEQYPLAEKMTLVKASDELTEKFSLESGGEEKDRRLFRRGLLSAFSAEKWAEDSAYLQLSQSGYVGQFVSTETTENVRSLLKSFHGLSIALRLMKVQHAYHPTAPKMYAYIHRITDGTPVIDGTDELPEDLSRTLSDLSLNDLDGDLDDDASKKRWTLRCLGKLKKVFSNTDQSERLVLAGQWFFDSCSGRNELLSFVQATITIEILLGDKATSDVIGLNELLRNRCAYLVGVDRKQRQEILTDFKNIYDIRSKIVHRGMSKLRAHERTLFQKLQWLCRRVIEEEIDLIPEKKEA